MEKRTRVQNPGAATLFAGRYAGIILGVMIVTYSLQTFATIIMNPCLSAILELMV
jgi:hypothetical protein